MEGQDFNYIDPQENKPANIKGFTALIDQPKSIWHEGQNSHWRGEYNKHFPKDGEYVPALKFTSEETKSINEIRTNLKTYVEESAARFITGDLSLEKDWDKYVSELEKLGCQNSWRCHRLPMIE